MEQERKIEKWLKAYAKKRRGQAGDSFKLDAATRQILQNEVSRSVESSNDEDETMSLWELLRKNWLYLMGFAACVFAVAALFLPNLNAPMRSYRASSTLSVAKSSAKVRSVTNSVASVAALTPPPPPPAAAAPEPASDKLETAAADIPAARHGNNVPVEAIPPAPVTPEPSIQPAAGIPATAAPGNYAMNTLPPNPAQIRAPVGEAARDFRGGGGGGGGGGLSFVPASQKAASPSQSAAVLVNFQVSQNGNTIRVVDQDGSIYTGSLQVEGREKNVAPVTVSSWAGVAAQNNVAAQNEGTAKTESPKVAQFDSSAGNANKENYASPPPAGISGVSTAAAESPAQALRQSEAQKYFFYAQGTNQTLKQSVVFAGTLLEDLSLASNAQQAFGMSANAALGAAFAQQFVRSVTTNQPVQIQGVAIIDNTFKIQINATSVPAKNNLPLK